MQMIKYKQLNLFTNDKRWKSSANNLSTDMMLHKLTWSHTQTHSHKSDNPSFLFHCLFCLRSFRSIYNWIHNTYTHRPHSIRFSFEWKRNIQNTKCIIKTKHINFSNKNTINISWSKKKWKLRKFPLHHLNGYKPFWSHSIFNALRSISWIFIDKMCNTSFMLFFSIYFFFRSVSNANDHEHWTVNTLPAFVANAQNV